MPNSPIFQAVSIFVPSMLTIGGLLTLAAIYLFNDRGLFNLGVTVAFIALAAQIFLWILGYCYRQQSDEE